MIFKNNILILYSPTSTKLKMTTLLPGIDAMDELVKDCITKGNRVMAFEILGGWKKAQEAQEKAQEAIAKFQNLLLSSRVNPQKLWFEESVNEGAAPEKKDPEESEKKDPEESEKKDPEESEKKDTISESETWGAIDAEDREEEDQEKKDREEEVWVNKGLPWKLEKTAAKKEAKKVSPPQEEKIFYTFFLDGKKVGTMFCPEKGVKDPVTFNFINGDHPCFPDLSKGGNVFLYLHEIKNLLSDGNISANTKTGGLFCFINHHKTTFETREIISNINKRFSK